MAGANLQFCDIMDVSKHPKKKVIDPEKVVKNRWSKNKVKGIRLVEVLWRDAVSISGDEWTESEEADEQVPAKTVSIGYLWKETDDFVTIVSLVNEIHIGYGITIPRGMIVEIRDLI